MFTTIMLSYITTIAITVTWHWILPLHFRKKYESIVSIDNPYRGRWVDHFWQEKDDVKFNAFMSVRNTMLIKIEDTHNKWLLNLPVESMPNYTEDDNSTRAFFLIGIAPLFLSCWLIIAMSRGMFQIAMSLLNRISVTDTSLLALEMEELVETKILYDSIDKEMNLPVTEPANLGTDRGLLA